MSQEEAAEEPRAFVRSTQLPEKKPYYTVAEAAQIIGICEQDVARLIESKVLGTRRVRGQVVIPAKVLDAYRPMSEVMRAMDQMEFDQAEITDYLVRMRRTARQGS